MHPIIFQIGPLQVRYYGLMYAISILCTLYLVRLEVRRKQIPLSDDDIMNFVMLPVIGGIIGARAYYVIFSWEHYRQHLGEIVKIWHGGLAIHGGILGGILVGWWLTRRHHLPFWRIADVGAPPLILAQALGRFGNLMNGDAHGLPTSMPWGLVFPPESIAGAQYPGIPLHPTMVYEMISNLSIFLLLWSIRKTPRKDGFLFCVYIALYSVGRFVISFFRADNLMFRSVSVAHVLSILLIFAALGMILRRRLWERTDHTDEPASSLT